MGGSRSTSTTAPKINQLSVQSSSLGVTIPRGWGTCRVKCNLVWYGAFRAIATTTKQRGKGGSVSSTTYSYTASVILGLGTGPIEGVRTLYRDKDVYTDLSQAGLSLAVGTPTQAPWGYLTSLFPDQALGYSRLAYVYASDYPLTDAASLRNHSFEVVFGSRHPGHDDAVASVVATDLLINPVHGVKGWTSDMIGDLTSWHDYCIASDLLISPLLDQQRPAAEFLQELADSTNTELFFSEGVLKAVPYGESAVTGNGVTWTPNMTPVYDLTEDDFHTSSPEGPPVTMEIVDQSDAYNIIQIEYLDRQNQYNTAIQPYSDLDNILEYGERRRDPTPLHAICRGSSASTLAQLICARTLNRREKYRFSLPWNFVLLEPMDLVTLTTTTDELRLNRTLVQIISIGEDDEDGVLTIEAEGVSAGSVAAATYDSHSGSGYYQDTSQAPGSVVEPVLINAPTSLTGGDPEVWCAVGSTSPTWGGCEVWVSSDDETYRLAGRVEGAARYGVATTALASHSDPDPSGTVGVDLSSSLGQLLSGSSLDLSVAATLCSVGGELIAYQSATLTSANHYTLSGLRRGLYGTSPADHVSGEPFVRIDDSLFRFSYGDMAVGSVLYVKFPSFNLWGGALEDIADLSPYTITLLPQFTSSTNALANFTLIPTGGIYISGQTVRKIGTASAWDASVRSAESFTNGAAVRFRPATADKSIVVGLNSDPATNSSFDSIDFGLYLGGGGYLNVLENGTLVSLPSVTYAAGDVLGVVYNGRVVTYTKNGTTIHTTDTAEGLTLYLDSSFADNGAEIRNLTFSSTGAPGLDGAAAVVGYLTNDSSTLPATSAGVVTDYSDARGQFVVEGATTTPVFSVHANPQALTYSGGPIIDSSGNYRVDGGFDEASATLTLKAVVDGLTILKTFSLAKSRAGADGSSPPLMRLQADRQVFTYAAGGSPSPSDQSVSLSVYRQNLSGTAVFTIKKADGSTVPSPESYLTGSGDSRSMSVSSFDSARGTTSGLQITATIGGLSDTVTLVQVANGANGTNGINGTNGTNGVTLYTWIAYADSADGSVNFTTGAPAGRAFIGIAANQSSSTESTNPGDYTWSQYSGPPAFGLVAGANCVVAGNKIYKVSAGGDWNAQVYSSESYYGGAFVSFRYEISTDLMLGLNSDPTTNSSYNTIDYAIRCNYNNLEVWNNGTTAYSAAGVLSVGDILAVHYDGTNVRYTRNGVQFFSHGTDPGLRLWIDSSFAHTSSSPLVSVINWTAAGSAGANGTNGTNGTDGTNGKTVSVSRASIALSATWQGTIKSGQLPVTFKATMRDGTADVSSSTSWSISSGSVTSSISSDGTVTITAVSADATLVVTATYGGVSYSVSVPVTVTNDPPPPQSPVSVFTGSVAIDNTTTQPSAPNSGTVLLRTSSSGQLVGNAYVDYYVNYGPSGSSRTYIARGIIYYRVAGGSTWTAFSEGYVDGSSAIAINNIDFETSSDPGSLVISQTQTGLSANTTYEVGMAIWKGGGSAGGSPASISGGLTVSTS